MNARTRDAGARTAMWVQLVDVLAQDRGNFPPDLCDNAYRWLEKWRGEVPERRRLAAAVSVSSRALPLALVDFFAKDVAAVATPVMARGKISLPGWIDRLPAWPSGSRAVLAERTDLPDELRRALGSLGPQALALPAATREASFPVAGPSPAEAMPFPPLVEKPSVIAPSHPAFGTGRVDTGSTQATADEILDLPLEAIVHQPEPEPVAPAEHPDETRAPEQQPAPVDEGVRPIGALLERIERYRRDNPANTPSRHADRASSAFVFEADRSGLINWVDGAPRGALIGLSIAEMALPGEGGVDGQAAGAFRKRAPFDHARLHVMGHGAAAGKWLISGAPLFESDNGRFLGYQGQARRMTPVQQESSGELLGGSLRPASVRQLVHELRTPLNAIRGFAEMIEGEFLGPVADPYRARATAIVRDSASLLRVFEDLENAARLESGDYAIAPHARTDLCKVARDVLVTATSITESHNLNLKVQLPDAQIEAAVDEASSNRLISGFIDLLAGVSADGQVIEIGLASRDGFAQLEALPGNGLRSRWDWSATIADDASLQSDLLPLGMGYKLRLLARLADRVGGSLHATGDRLSLLLPLASASEGQTRNG